MGTCELGDSVAESREVKLPADIHSQIEKARRTFHRFGQYSDALERIRTDIAKAPIENRELQPHLRSASACLVISTLPRLPGDLITIPSSTNNSPVAHELSICSAMSTSLTWSVAWSLRLPNSVTQTYVFAKPKSMAVFLADYARTTKEDILDNRSNVAERLGYLGRVVHGTNPRGWLKKIKAHVGEPSDFVQL